MARRSPTSPASPPPAPPAPRAPPAPAAPPEEVADPKLVTEAAKFLKKTAGETVQRGLFQFGEYLFDRFYDGDVARVRDRNPAKAASLSALFALCETVDLPISRSTLSAAVNVAMMGRLLAENAVAFRQLPSSHQVTLLPLKDPSKVERLAQRVLHQDLSVRQTRAMVGEEVARRTLDAPVRGRTAAPFVLKGLRGATRVMSSDGGRLAFTRAQIDELSEAQAAEALRSAQALVAALSKLVERLEER